MDTPLPEDIILPLTAMAASLLFMSKAVNADPLDDVISPIIRMLVPVVSIRCVLLEESVLSPT